MCRIHIYYSYLLENMLDCFNHDFTADRVTILFPTIVTIKEFILHPSGWEKGSSVWVSVSWEPFTSPPTHSTDTSTEISYLLPLLTRRKLNAEKADLESFNALNTNWSSSASMNKSLPILARHWFLCLFISKSIHHRHHHHHSSSSKFNTNCSYLLARNCRSIWGDAEEWLRQACSVIGKGIGNMIKDDVITFGWFFVDWASPAQSFCV